MISLLLIASAFGQVVYPEGCTEATFPDPKECLAKNWDLGPDARDRCAPVGNYI
jgi:hypothetical protein